MKANQKGFSVVEALIALVIVGLIGLAGWYVWQKQSNNQTDNATLSTTKSGTAAFTDCHTEVDKVSKTSDSGMKLYEWTTVEHTKVVLSDWNVSLTLPESMVGNAVCRYTSNGYEFSTKPVVNDDKCVAYYRTDELASEGVRLWQYPANTAAEGQINGASGTLDDYYKAHKATNGNYFTDPATGRSYYKVGDSFYVAFGDANGALDKYKTARTAACKDEKPDFRQPFVEAMASLRQQ